MDEQMAAWMKYAEPAEEHGFLKKMEGTWKAHATMWMQPGAPPQESDATMVNELILGGRFLQSKYEGDTPWGPFAGMALDGYDRFKKKYIGLWTDTMSTMMMIFEGSVDGDVRTMMCECIDPMTNKSKQMKGVTTIVSENEHRYESWCPGPDGEPFRNMEIVYKR